MFLIRISTNETLVELFPNQIFGNMSSECERKMEDGPSKDNPKLLHCTVFISGILQEVMFY